MKVKEIRARNFKGATFAHELAPMTLFYGPNMAGKTSRLDAITLALLGYVPRLGKRNSDAFAYASADVMGVEALLDAGKGESEVIRVWQRTAKGVISYGGPSGPCDVSPVVLDPNEYFGLSERDRMKLVFGLCKVDGAGELQKLANEVSALPATEGIAGVAECVGLATICLKAKFDSVQEAVERFVETTAAKRKEAEAAGKRLSAAVVVGDAQQPLDAVPMSAEELKQAIAEADKQQKQFAAKAKKLNERRLALTTEQARVVQLEDALARESSMRAKLAELREGKVTSDEAKASKKLRELQAAQREHEQTVAKMEADLQNHLNRMADLTAQYFRNRKDDRCPVCGCVGDDFKDRLKAKYTTELAALTAVLTDAKDALRIVQKRLNELNSQVAKAEADAKLAQGKLAQWEADQRQAGEIEAELNQMEGLKAEYDKLARAGDRRVALAEAEQELKAVEGEAKGLKSKWADLYGKLAETEKSMERAAQRAAVIAEAGKAKAEGQFWKAAQKAGEAAQSRMVGEAFGDLLKKANRLFQPVVGKELEFRSGEVGMQSEGQWVTWRTFSGIEQLMCYTAVSVALAPEGTLRLVLLDEIGRMDLDTRDEFYAHAVALVEQGHVDQFVLADTECWKPAEGELFKAIKIGGNV